MSGKFMTDDEARNIVINKINQNVFTPAGAGSGKTTSLVKRLITIVKEGRSVDRICTITFTVNAANEFYQRFQELLIEEEGKLKKEGKMQELLYVQNALKDIDKCFMGTIDSFFQQILRENSASTNVSSSFEIVDEEVYKEFIGDYFDALSRKNDRDVKTIIDIFGISGKEFFKAAIFALLPYREYEVKYERIGLSDIKTIEGINKARILDCINFALSDKRIGIGSNVDIYNRLRDYKELNCDWSSNILKIYNYLKVIYKYNCNSKSNYKASYGKLSEEQEAFFEERKKLFGENGEIKNEIINLIDNYRATVLIETSLNKIRDIQREKELKGIYTFSDVTKAVYDMLVKDAKGDAKIIRRIQEKYDVFLLDEFQDTHPMCSEIFYILSSKAPCSDWNKCEPKDGSLFIVGDSKQSIYRFNGADIEAFDRIQDKFVVNVNSENVKATLTKNFRSNDKLKDWFNNIFSKMFVKGKYQTDFDLIELENNPNLINKFKVFDDNDQDKKQETDNPVFFYNTDRDSDAINVLGIVRTLVNNDDYLIRSKGDSDIRKIRYSDFMILTKSKNDLDRYANIFSKNDIPYFVEGYNDFSKSEAFVSIFNILNAVCFDDSLSLYRALKSKPIGFSEEYLLELKSKDLLDLGKIDKLDENSYIYKIYKMIRELKTIVDGNTLSNIYERVMIDFDCVNRCSIVSYNFAFSALENLKNAENEGRVSSLEDGIKLLESFLENNKERVLNLEVKQNAIHLSNLHKVKGLEAPIVILAYSSDRSQGTSISVDNINKTITPLYFKLDDNKRCSITTDISKEKIEEESEASEQERIRLLYVASTRAHNVLIISKTKSNYWGPLIDDGMKEFVIEDRELIKINAHIPSYTFIKTNNDISKVKKETYEIVKPSVVHAIEKTDDSVDRFNLSEVKMTLGSLITGTVVHKLMEVLVNSGFEMDENSVIKEALNDNNVYEISEELENSFKKVINTILNGGYKQEKGPADLVAELKGATCYCEVPFSYNKNGIVNGVIDLLYYKDGKYHIVDYKTDSEFSNIDMRHEEQLKLYEEAVKQYLGEVIIDSRIYHIAI